MSSYHVNNILKFHFSNQIWGGFVYYPYENKHNIPHDTNELTFSQFLMEYMTSIDLHHRNIL